MEDVYGLKTASECDGIVRDYCKGSRPNAKKALKQIAKQSGCALPRRYLARLIYHEAAGSISPGTVGSGSSLKRIQLLQDAYEHAAEATVLAPNSLSCAALRATLAINLLVEESALLNPTSKPGKKSSGVSALDKKCQELRDRFRGSIDACRVALEHPNPEMVEPVITMITATHTTCDPCSLLQERILEWFKSGSWQEIITEKRSVLTSMQQVLQSCHALLDSTQVPVNSIIKLLQHILRPYGAEQQMLASSRVGTNGAAASASPVNALQFPTAQLHHAAIGELLRLLRPAAGAAQLAAPVPEYEQPHVPAAVPAAAPAVAAPAGNEVAPLPLSVEKPWDAQEAAAAAAPKAATPAGGRGKGRAGRGRSTAASGAARKKERSRREQFMDVESFWRSCTPEQRLQLLQVPLAPLLEGVKRESGSEVAEELMEGLVLLREQASTSARYWLCAACDRKFHTAGDFAAHLEACHEQLVLVRHQGQHPGQLQAAAAPVDAGAAVPAAAPPASQQQQQLPPVGVTAAGGISYVTCSKCQAEVVGMYFSSIPPQAQQPQQQQQVQQHQLCLKCYRQVSASVGAATAEQAYTRVAPHAPALACPAWSESGSEFISTRDSFSSCEENESEDDPEAMQVRQLHTSIRQRMATLPQGRVPSNCGGDGQLTAQQQRQLTWLSAVVNKGIAAQTPTATPQQPDQQLAAAAQGVPAGMFVFGSNSSTAGTPDGAAVGGSATLGSETDGTAAPGLAAVPTDMPQIAPGSYLQHPINTAVDGLSRELIAELEAVHAARRCLLTAQSAATGQQQMAGSSQQPSELAAAADAAAQESLSTDDSAVDSGVSNHIAATTAAGEDGTASETGTPTAAGRTWRDWLLPKKLLQWSEGDEVPDESLMVSEEPNSLAMSSPLPMQAQSYTASAGATSSGKPTLSSSSSGAVAGGNDGNSQQQDKVAGSSGVQRPGHRSAPCSPRTPAAIDSSRQPLQSGGVSLVQAAAASNLPLTSQDTEAPADLESALVLADRQHPAQQKPAADVSSKTSSRGHSSKGAAAAEYWQAPSIIEAMIGNTSNAMQITCIASTRTDVLVDEIIRCMAQVYAADKDIADMTLSCLVDFVRRRLLVPGPELGPQQQQQVPSANSSTAPQKTPSAEQHQQQVLAAAASLAPAEFQLVQQFIASPEAAYLSPDMMYAALSCLSAGDLQMALAYVVRQHEDCMVQPEHSDSEGETASQSLLPEDDAGCMPLFQLHNLDELSFEQLVEHIWPGELGEQQAAAASAAGSAANGKGSRNGSSRLSATLRSRQQQRQQGTPAIETAPAPHKKLSLAQEPKLLPANWWLEHLQQSGKASDPPAAAAADLRVLRWVYGNIVSSQAEEFSSAQAALRGQLDRNTALLELYEGMANAWRRMQRVADRRRTLEQLRQNIKTHFAVVRSQEESGEHCSGQEAVAFLEALFTSLCTSSCNNTATPASKDTTSSSSTPPAIAAAGAQQTQPPEQKEPAATNASAGAAQATMPPLSATGWPAGMTLTAPPAPPLALPVAGGQVQPSTAVSASAGDSSTQAVSVNAPGAAAVSNSSAPTPQLPAAAGMPASAVSQLQVRLNQLAPLYLCEPAVEVVRSAPALAREASQRYARALLERELSVLALIEAMLDDDVSTARQKLQGANDRLLARRTELSTTEAEHTRIAAEGPASHRKKDFLDKATKEAEHREKLADLKAKIDAAKAAIAEDEVTAAAADLAAADAQADLARVREQARQIAARRKNLEDLNAQLSTPVPPLTAAALAAAASTNGVLGPNVGGPPVPRMPPVPPPTCSCCPPVQAAPSSTVAPVSSDQGAGSGAGAVVKGEGTGSSSAVDLGWSWRAQRLECLMYRVLWVAEAVKLFQAQYEPRSGGKQYELLVRASKWVKERCDEYDSNFQAAAEDLSNLRQRVQQLACVDLTFEINEAALKYVRNTIEAEAATAQERRSQQLLLELSAEEEAKKKLAEQQQQLAAASTTAAAQHDKQQGSGSGSSTGPASGGSAKAAKGKKGKQGKDQQKQLKQQQQHLQTEHQRLEQEEAARQALEAARKARELALEAELEQRRKELEQLEAEREAELIRQAEEASLREQQALKRAQEANERALREQQALADAAAVLAAAADAGDLTSLVGSSGGSSEGQGSGGRTQQQQGRGPRGGTGKASSATTHQQRGSKQQQPPTTPSKGSTRTGAASRGAAAVTGTGTAAAVAAGTNKTAKATSPAAQTAGRQRAGTQQHQQQQGQVRAQNAGSSGTAAQVRKGARAPGGQTAVAPPPPPPAVIAAAAKLPQQQQQPTQAAPSLLDFGPTPAEAYAAAQAAKEQHAKEAAAAAREQAITAKTAAAGAETMSAQKSAVRSIHIQQGSGAAAVPGVSTNDEVVDMPASAVGGSSHLSRLSLAHMDEVVQPAAAVGVRVPLGPSVAGLSSSGSAGALAPNAATDAAVPSPLSLRSSSTPLMPVLGDNSSNGSGFDPFRSSYGPADGLLLQPTAVADRQTHQQARPSALQLQSAGSAPLAAELSFGGLAGLAQQQVLEVRTPASHTNSMRHDLPPRPSTALGGAVTSSHAMDPGSPLMMGSSPADAPHIQSIMSLLDGDTGGINSSSSQQQQQLSRPSTSDSADGAAAAGGRGSRRGRQSGRNGGRGREAQTAAGSYAAAGGVAGGQQHEQQRPRQPPNGSGTQQSFVADMTGPAISGSAAVGRSPNGAAAVPRRSTGSSSSVDMLSAGFQNGPLSPLGAAAAGGGGPPGISSSSSRPSSAASSTTGLLDSGIMGLQQQQQAAMQQSWLPQHQQGAGAGWSMLAAGDGGAWGTGPGVPAGDHGMNAAAGYSTAREAPESAAGAKAQMASTGAMFTSQAGNRAAPSGANVSGPISCTGGLQGPSAQQQVAAAAAAAAASAAASKARQQQSYADPLAFGDGGLGMYSAALSSVAAFSGAAVPSVGPASLGLGGYGGLGLGMSGFGANPLSPVGGVANSGLSGYPGVATGGLAGYGTPGGLWNWQQGLPQQQQAAAAMAALMQQQARAGRSGLATPAGIQGLWQQQPQPQGRGGKQQPQQQQGRMSGAGMRPPQW